MQTQKPFPEEAFKYLKEVEENHWWFCTRNQIILWVMQTKMDQFTEFLEVGCGTGYVLQGIAQAMPELRLEASEYFDNGLEIARKRVPQCQFRQLDATKMSEVAAYDCIGCFDVLEHIDNDQLVLQNFFRALRQNGYLLITVPQHPGLWSGSDNYAEHRRRYRSQELIKKALQAGFRIEYTSSFVSLLLPLMAVQRIRSRQTTYDPDVEFKVNGLISKAFYAVMQLEMILLKLGLRFPAGGSRLLLARKA